MHSLVKYLVIV